MGVGGCAFVNGPLLHGLGDLVGLLVGNHRAFVLPLLKGVKRLFRYDLLHRQLVERVAPIVAGNDREGVALAKRNAANVLSNFGANAHKNSFCI